jgi:hypothetical protein
MSSITAPTSGRPRYPHPLRSGTPTMGPRRFQSGAGAASILALARGLLPGLPAHLLFEPPLGRAAGRCDSLLSPQLLRSLPELLRDLRPLEIAAERRVLDVVVGSELPQRLAGRPAPNQLRVGNELAQSTPALHNERF